MRKRFAYDEKGFLLLEHLISIVITGVLMIVFVSLMQVVSTYTSSQTALTMHEVNTLIIRIQNEVRLADSFTVTDDQLFAHFPHRGEVIGFSVQNNRLLRQVNGRGGEIMAYHVIRMNVDLSEDNLARVILKSPDGKIFRFSVRALQVAVNRPEDEEEDTSETNETDETNETNETNASE